MTFASIFGVKPRPIDGPSVQSAGAMRLTLTLPPPSLNNAFRNVPGIGRVKTKHYRRWIRDAGWEITAQRPEPVNGPVYVWFELGEKASRADADNLIKAMFDLLVSQHLIEADSKKCVRGYAVRWINSRDFRIAIERAS
jgi:Holliday junction resolvase RusA-like endonuclease